MEEINEGIKHILSFLHVVQDSVNDYRRLLDQAYQKEYHAFVQDWKKVNKQKKQIRSSELKPDVKAQSEAEVNPPINIEELDQAEQLLEKARKIRKQSFELMTPQTWTGTVVDVSQKKNELDVKPLDSKYCHRATKKPSSQTGQGGEITLSKLKTDGNSGAKPKYNMPASLPKQPKTSGHQRNIHVRGDAKPLRSSKGQTSAHTKSTDRKVSSFTSKSKLPSHLHAAVVSKETLLSLKNLCIADATLSSPNLTVADRKGNSKVLNPVPLRNEKAEMSEVTISQKCFPTHREFHKVLNDRLKERNCLFKLDKKWAWYTFLGSKEEVHMSRVISCNSYEDLKKAHVLLSAMQEAMFWFDLFNLIKTEICPHLQKLDKNDRSTTQIIQYLKNICSADYKLSALAHLKSRAVP